MVTSAVPLIEARLKLRGSKSIVASIPLTVPIASSETKLKSTIALSLLIVKDWQIEDKLNKIENEIEP